MPAASSSRRIQLLRRHLIAADSSQGKEEDPRQPVCVVIGAGSGVGQGVARAFAAEGLHVVCVRRSDEVKLEALAADKRIALTLELERAIERSAAADGGGAGGHGVIKSGQKRSSK